MGLLIRFARQWVAGETMDDAVRVALDANRRGIHALVNHLGEHYREKAPVEATVQEYIHLVAKLRAARVDGDVSIKPTQFGIFIDRAYALSQIVPVLDATKAWGRIFWVDMEAASTIADTVWIYENLRRRYDQVGLCLQANIRRTADDLEQLLPLGARIRLVKGAYKETPDVAFTSRAEIDRAYLRHLETLFAKGRHFAVASHDGRMIDRALELSKAHPDVPFEFAMLQGVRDPLKLELVSQGHRVTEYIPYGPTWLPYFTRRLRERPRNIITMVRSFVSG
ncbi:MAG TPA: proline dehydrogenase family protein [Thermoplasmata archaeon]|nr:proline dehydrogenase family protein [Thermoplasmata archaeon]